MTCPVCGGSERMVINIRVQHDSDLSQVVGSTWDGRNMARCDECGVLYDHQYIEPGSSDSQGESPINCPECGSPNDATRDSCSYCDEPLPSSG